MARPINAAAQPVDDIEVLPAVAQDIIDGQEERAIAEREQDKAVRSIAAQVGYQLPADSTDPDLIQRDISANMRRSVEACLEVGRGLLALKAACGHGNFMVRLEVLSINDRVARNFMNAAAKFSKRSLTTDLAKAIGNQTKLFELLILDDEQIDELATAGEASGIALDDIATMSVKELRAALREAKAEKQATSQLLADKNTRIDKLAQEVSKTKQRMAVTPPDEVWVDLQREASGIAARVAGAIMGDLRNALEQLETANAEREEAAPAGRIFMSGLIGQAEQALHQLREMYFLPQGTSAGKPEWQQWADAEDAKQAAESAAV